MSSKANRKNRNGQGKQPDLIAYHVPARDNAPWNRIGAAWAHNDGKGYSLQLDLVPVGESRIVLREIGDGDA